MLRCTRYLVQTDLAPPPLRSSVDPRAPNFLACVLVCFQHRPNADIHHFGRPWQRGRVEHHTCDIFRLRSQCQMLTLRCFALFPIDHRSQTSRFSIHLPFSTTPPSTSDSCCANRPSDTILHKQPLREARYLESPSSAPMFPR